LDSWDHSSDLFREEKLSEEKAQFKILQALLFFLGANSLEASFYMPANSQELFVQEERGKKPDC